MGHLNLMFNEAIKLFIFAKVLELWKAFEIEFHFHPN